MKNLSLADILELDVSERLRLVEDIWDSIAAHPESVPVTDAQREELDRRLARQERHPEPGSPWDDVKKRLTPSK